MENYVLIRLFSTLIDFFSKNDSTLLKINISTKFVFRMEDDLFCDIVIEKDLPTVEERLSALRPSRQLLEFYRTKVEDLESEHDSLSVKLNDFSKICENEAKLERTIRQREKEISDLQKALSDLQVFKVLISRRYLNLLVVFLI